MKILITGASGGIGLELTKRLAVGNEIIAIARDKANLDKMKDEISSDQIKTCSLDVSDSREVGQIFNALESLDVLINCAAILEPVGPFLENSLEKWRKNIEVNLLGTVNMCYFAMPLLLKSRRGKVINFSGGGGANGRPYHTAYASSKTAVVRFSETVALEYPQLDINAIAPGAYKTNMWKAETHDKEPEKWGDMSRLGDFVTYLCSEKSDGITGRFIHYKDNWESFDRDSVSKDIFTLRRVEK